MKIRRYSDAAITFLLCFLIAVLTVFSHDAKQGAKEGLGICEGIIIPSLLPVLIICKFLINSRLQNTFQVLFGKVFEKVFLLPKESAAAIILGLVSGYPAGAILTLSLFERGEIGESTAQRIMTFNVCGGAAFIITAVGTVIYGSTKLGLILYLCCVLSSLIIAFITRFTQQKKNFDTLKEKAYLNLNDAFCTAVEDTVKALAVMCAYIVFFSVLCSLINPPEYLVPLLEITNGICAESTPEPQYAVFFIAFGGICIHLQLLPFLSKMKVKYYKFFIGRMGAAVLSFALFKVYSELFYESEAVFSNISSPVYTFSSGGIALSTVMIIGCAVIVFDIENRKIKLHL